MKKTSHFKPFALLLIVSFFLTGCLTRRTVIPVDERLLPAQMMSRPDLVKKLEDFSRAIQTLNATVTLSAAEGALSTGILKQYPDTKAYILVERPLEIRIQAQGPLVLGTVFDMVSDGDQYKASIPSQNKFIMGDEDAPPASENRLLNLRPNHVRESLFIDIVPYRNAGTHSILEEVVQGRQSFYVMHFIRGTGDTAQLAEKVWVDRANLEIARKQVFREDGKLVTDVQFSQYQAVGAILFPQVIEIKRPIEDFSLKMTFQRTLLNEPLPEDAFVLDRPNGSELVQLGPGTRP